jgi:hypothetical protein
LLLLSYLSAASPIHAFISIIHFHCSTMSSQSQQTIHILNKSNYTDHHLVFLPLTPPADLAPSSLRLRSRILGLTTNNLTYARMGHFMGWYDVYPLPPNTPAPYNDSKTYGRIAAWGYAEIVDSTVPGIKVGQSVYGFLPIGTGTEDVCVEYASHNDKKIESQLLVLDAHRQHVWKLYNRLQLCPSIPTLETRYTKDGLGWDALMQGLFATGYNLNRYGFAWDEELRIHPSGNGAWSAGDADLKEATVVMLNASGKTAGGFAWALRRDRPLACQPKTIVGVGSEVSVGTIEKGGLFDKVVLNSDDDATKSWIEGSGAKRVILLEFGSRPGVAERWTNTLRASSVPFTLVTVGGEVQVQDPEKAKKRLKNISKLNLVNAGLLREKGIEVGGEEYFEEFYGKWEEFKGEIKGMRVEWAEGMEKWEEGWEAFCRDEVRADRGLVYKI